MDDNGIIVLRKSRTIMDLVLLCDAQEIELNWVGEWELSADWMNVCEWVTGIERTSIWFSSWWSDVMIHT